MPLYLCLHVLLFVFPLSFSYLPLKRLTKPLPSQWRVTPLPSTKEVLTYLMEDFRNPELTLGFIKAAN